MEVQLENGQKEAVLANVLRPLSTPEITYNFQVENEHDYFVGPNQILVHNACLAGVAADAKRVAQQRAARAERREAQSREEKWPKSERHRFSRSCSSK